MGRTIWISFVELNRSTSQLIDNDGRITGNGIGFTDGMDGYRYHDHEKATTTTKAGKYGVYSVLTHSVVAFYYCIFSSPSRPLTIPRKKIDIIFYYLLMIHSAAFEHLHWCTDKRDGAWVEEREGVFTDDGQGERGGGSSLFLSSSVLDWVRDLYKYDDEQTHIGFQVYNTESSYIAMNEC